MNTILMGALVVLMGLSGCSTSKPSTVTSAEQGQKLLAEDQRAIEKAEAEWKEAVLKHGASSDEAVKAQTALDQAKNKLAADQTHVQQLQQIEARESQSTTPTPTVTTPPAEPQ